MNLGVGSKLRWQPDVAQRPGGGGAVAMPPAMESWHWWQSPG
jgi:hypothetical protein